MILEVVGFRMRASHKHKVLKTIVYFWMTKTLSECRCDRRSLNLSVDSKKSSRCSRITEGEVLKFVDDMNLVRYINDVNDLETCEPMLEWT